MASHFARHQLRFRERDSTSLFAESFLLLHHPAQECHVNLEGFTMFYSLFYHEQHVQIMLNAVWYLPNRFKRSWSALRCWLSFSYWFLDLQRSSKHGLSRSPSKSIGPLTVTASRDLAVPIGEQRRAFWWPRWPHVSAPVNGNKPWTCWWCAPSPLLWHGCPASDVSFVCVGSFEEILVSQSTPG